MKNNISIEDLDKTWQKYLDLRLDPEFVQMTLRFPYCESKCNFCKYDVSVSCDINKYIDVLKQQINVFSKTFKNYYFKVFKIVGGSFNILPIENQREILKLIKDNFNFNYKDHIFSIEVSNANLTEEMIDLYDSFKFNKILMGIQSFDENILNSWNRYSKINYSIMEYISKKMKLCVDIIHDVDNHSVELFNRDFEIAKKYADIVYLYHMGSRDKEQEWINYLKDYFNKNNYNYRFYGDDFAILVKNIELKNVFSTSTFNKFESTLALGEDVYGIISIFGVTYDILIENNGSVIRRKDPLSNVDKDGPLMHKLIIDSQTNLNLYDKIKKMYEKGCYEAGF